jgi:hypothetical protein
MKTEKKDDVFVKVKDRHGRKRPETNLSVR